MRMFHIHRWKVVYKRGAQIVQQCKKCGSYRSTRFDMKIGKTRWVNGNLWMLPPIKAKLNPPVRSEIIDLVD